MDKEHEELIKAITEEGDFVWIHEEEIYFVKPTKIDKEKFYKWIKENK